MSPLSLKYITYAVFLPHDSIQEVKSRDPLVVDVPSYSYGFRFCDVLTTRTIYKGDVVELFSPRVNPSSTYFYGGTVYSKEGIIENFPEQISSIEKFGMDPNSKYIQCRNGRILPFYVGDIILEEKVTA